MKNITNLKAFLVYLFFYLQIFSFSFSYIYWRQFGINVQDYMTYGDIIFSQATNVVIFVCVLAFLIFSYLSYLKRKDRREVKYPKFYFLLSVVISVASFFVLLNRDHAVLHEFVMPLFSMSILLIPIFFTFCSWFEKYFSSAREAIIYSATFVTGFYILTIWPVHNAEKDFQRMLDESYHPPIVSLVSCKACNLKSLGKLGDYVILYDSEKESVLAVHDRNINFIRHALP